MVLKCVLFINVRKNETCQNLVETSMMQEEKWMNNSSWLMAIFG